MTCVCLFQSGRYSSAHYCISVSGQKQLIWQVKVSSTDHLCCFFIFWEGSPAKINNVAAKTNPKKLLLTWQTRKATIKSFQSHKLLDICCSITGCYMAQTQLLRLCNCPGKDWLPNYTCGVARDEWLRPDKIITVHHSDSWAKLADQQAVQALGTAGMCWKCDALDIDQHQSTSRHDLHTRLTWCWWKMTICDVSHTERSKIGVERAAELM